LAFEEDFGQDPSQPQAQNYTLNATGLISRTVSVWTRNLAKYIVIVGIVGAVSVAISFVLLFALFGLVGVIPSDPISYIFSIFTLTTFPDVTLIAVSLGFAFVAFVINAIVIGAAIKFALDDYGEQRGDVGLSFSHSFGRISRIVFVQIVLSFLVTVVLTPGLILLTRAMDVIDISDPFNPIFPPGSIELLMSAFGLMIIGGIFLIYLQARFVPTLAIVLDTELSAIESLKKSWSLTRGNILHVLGGQFLAMLVTVAFSLIISIGVSAILLPIDLTLVIESIITTLIFSAFSLIFGVVLYRDLVSRTRTSDLPEYVL
jgi:hypothetical protein